FKIWQCPSTCSRGWMYNTSMMLMDAGHLEHVYLKFRASPKAEINRKNAARWLGSDQAIISPYIVNCPVWTDKDGIYSFRGHLEKKNPAVVPEDAVAVGFFGKQYSPEKFLHLDWVASNWH